jgi:superfamily II DNA or RNA helicase
MRIEIFKGVNVFILFHEYNKKLIYFFYYYITYMNFIKMNQTNGYIYVRNHPSYDLDNACKMGKAINIPERDTQYATGEIKRGYFEVVFEVPNKKMGIVERLLQNEFRELNIKYDAGTEFYNKKIITLIEPYLMTLGINYKKLTKQEIRDLVRCNRVKQTIKKINIQSLVNILKSKRTNKQIISYIPRNDQTIIIGKSVIHFQINEKGLLIIPCGVGKTLISLWITQELNSNTILIGVPNKLLLKQWEQIICVLFQNIPYLIVSSGIDIENIMQFLENNQKKCIVITTYSSAHKVYTATQDTRFVFGMKINDECHHLTSNNINEEERKTYINMLKIKSNKQLSLTATLKLLENKEYAREDEMIVSNDNVEYFGEIIDRKSLLWAINKNIICDYVIQTIIRNEEQLEHQLSIFHIIEENDKRLFLSVFASLKSIFDGHSHHVLIYSNNMDNSLKLIQYIKMLIHYNYFDIPDLYYSNYHSEMKSKNQKEIINNFEKAKFGIITCVYCLGEGWDFPLLDGVVFAENMSSNIRIVQSALRASRKNKHQPNKITKIILPILNKDDWLENNNNPDLKKVREVIYQMGLEDETITQKIKVFRIDIEKQKPKTREKEEREMLDEFGEYDDELTQKLRLKTIRRAALTTTYEKARKIIADKNIKSKEEYFELCKNDNRLSNEPEIVFKGQFTNWIEYLSIERVYYDLETCKNKVGEYLLVYPEIKKHYLELSIVSNELCKIDALFPPNGLWVEYYDVKDLRDIITITNKKKKMGVIL